jgi:hypothetical protein
VGVALLALAACTSSAGTPAEGSAEPGESQVPTVVAAAPDGPVVLTGRSAPEITAQASAALWQASPVAVTVADGDPAALADAATRAEDLVVPLLVLPQQPGGPSGGAAATGAGDGSPTPGAGGAPSPVDPGAEELARLGVTHVLHVGPGQPQLPGIAVVAGADDLPEYVAAQPESGLTALTAPDSAAEGPRAAALAALRAAGAAELALSDVDPRVSPADVEAMDGRQAAGVIGVGAGFGSEETFTDRVESAVTGVQLPGGGQTIFDDKRYVALYGHPLTSALGVLGEQGPEASVARATKVAATYEPYAQERIVPAFEIIATVAAGAPGKDGNYSNEWGVDVLRPLVDAAGENGVYVILDLQSGRSDFLSQAQQYEELLLEPHVGLALDPEWRLAPGQKPLAQIGSVSAEEINQTMAWLAELTADNDLPQKMVLLHQFRTDMITDRPDLDLSHDELAVIVQMDGDGTLGQKLDTWGALLADAPEGLRFGWKNFYDEDEPTPTPAQTFGVDPKPWWVSYQ